MPYISAMSSLPIQRKARQPEQLLIADGMRTDLSWCARFIICISEEANEIMILNERAEGPEMAVLRTFVGK